MGRWMLDGVQVATRRGGALAIAQALPMLAIIICCGCGHGARLTPVQDGTASPAVMAQLERYLASELARLGKADGSGIDVSSVARHVSLAASGTDNIVFDLGATVVDPDGLGAGEPPTAVELGWTEQLAGDYDQNGEVNQGDLTPIAQYWQEAVQYDAASLHGGFALWPAGDPGSAGILPAMILLKRAAGASTLLSAASRASEDSCRLEGSAPRQAAAATEGQANWRKARVDGNGDGLLYLYDVTPIAAHWQERSDGYRVYRRAPGETQYQLLPNPDNAVGAEHSGLPPFQWRLS